MRSVLKPLALLVFSQLAVLTFILPMYAVGQ
jgi:hypothetical protein